MSLEGCITSFCQTLGPSLDFDELGRPLELVMCEADITDVFLCLHWDGTQGFMYVNQALYQLSYIASEGGQLELPGTFGSPYQPLVFPPYSAYWTKCTSISHSGV